MTKKDAQPCPCGGPEYERCCGRYIDNGEIPETAEQLMRSRYSAYVLHKEPYLKSTWHPSTRPVDTVAQDDGTLLRLTSRRERLGRVRMVIQDYAVFEVERRGPPNLATLIGFD